MPRPAPRPYECVRRAWHSDRHHPIRGSLIQEIFRVVNEVHSSSTKKNREWQKKLPIVVLKAEEIIYSRANSEAEYMDLKTLWGRVNDAIDTIIRREASTETGELLPPCVEAALHLGCTPRRASRSQRNSNPRCYLSASSSPTPACVSPSNLELIIRGNHITSTLLTSPNSDFVTHSTDNLNNKGSDFDSPKPLKINSISTKFSSMPGLPEAFRAPCLPPQTNLSSNSCSVFPLCCGNQLQGQGPKFRFCIPHPNVKSKSDIAATNKNTQEDLTNNLENLPEIGCDLSLRLSTFDAGCVTMEDSRPLEVEDVGPNTSQEKKRVEQLRTMGNIHLLPSGHFL